MALDREPWAPEPGKPFYMTDAITDHAVRLVRDAQRSPSPLALYLAYTAPHWPLHALPEDLAKYRGKYGKGWDVLREERRERQRGMGLALPSWGLSPRDSAVPAWSSLDAKSRDEWDLRMAVYAAQVDRMDRGIGRVLDALRETGRLDRTLVLFVSDNGGCAEENIGGEKAAASPVPGVAESFTSYRRPWANASNTPFRYWKQMTHEGGISTPGILWRAGLGRRAGSFTDEPAHVIDVMPTLLAAAGAPHPPTAPLEGRSLLPVLEGKRPSTRPLTAWEHQGHRAIRSGDWKLVSSFQQPWELYNLAEDRSELHDLSGRDPKRAAAMQSDWQRWADRCEVKPWAEIRGGGKPA
jgi:arylsulfatase